MQFRHLTSPTEKPNLRADFPARSRNLRLAVFGVSSVSMPKSQHRIQTQAKNRSTNAPEARALSDPSSSPQRVPIVGPGLFLLLPTRTSAAPLTEANAAWLHSVSFSGLCATLVATKGGGCLKDCRNPKLQTQTLGISSLSRPFDVELETASSLCRCGRLSQTG